MPSSWKRRIVGSHSFKCIRCNRTLPEEEFAHIHEQHSYSYWDGVCDGCRRREVYREACRRSAYIRSQMLRQKKFRCFGMCGGMVPLERN